MIEQLGDRDVDAIPRVQRAHPLDRGDGVDADIRDGLIGADRLPLDIERVGEARSQYFLDVAHPRGIDRLRFIDRRIHSNYFRRADMTRLTAVLVQSGSTTS